MKRFSQDYNNVEHIIIDGKSTDGTIDIIKSYGDKISYFISEQDDGIYDAMNKGIRAATGDVIGVLNSDDFYPCNHIISDVVKKFNDHDTDSVYGDLVYVDDEQTDKVTRYWQSKHFSMAKIRKGWTLPHPTFFVKREAYEKYGVFRTDLKIAADFDILVRFLFNHKISYSYIQEVLVKMRIGGVSTSFNSIWIISIEQLQVCRDNGMDTNIFKILLKYPGKMLGYFK